MALLILLFSLIIMSLSLGPENSSLLFNFELRRDSFSSEILELREVSMK